MKKTTIQERGPILPIGIANQDGSFDKNISFRSWRMKEERELGELRDANRNMNLPNYVSMILATMCTQIGQCDFQNMKLEEKRLVIGQMFMGDIFYAYILLRINSLGPTFLIDFQPEWSDEQITVQADLNTVEVNTIDNFKEACWSYVLKDPIEIRGKKVESFSMGPQRWSCLESRENLYGNNSSLAKLIVIKSSILGLNDSKEEILLADSELDELSKRDIEILIKEIDDNGVGPIMIIEGKHKNKPYRVPIDWSYDNFFGISSV